MTVTQQPAQTAPTASPKVGRTALYRLFGEDGMLLYVGIARSPEARWVQHAAEKEWWHQVRVYAVEWLADATTAWDAEGVAIREERPLYNQSRSPWRPGVAPDGRLVPVPRPPNMAPRQIRIPDKEWADFDKAAKAAGTDRATLVREFIAWYLRKDDAKLPKRPVFK